METKTCEICGKDRVSFPCSECGMQKIKIKTKEEARQYAIEWQNWMSKRELPYGELLEWQIYFEDIANSFGLYDEFKENGLI